MQGIGFRNDIANGQSLARSSLKSPNFKHNTSGWSINQDGSAEFQNITARGTITGATITGATITGGTITGTTVIGSDFRSSDYVAQTSGFDLSGPPGGPDNVEFNSIVNVPAGTVNVGKAPNQITLQSVNGGASYIFINNGKPPGNGGGGFINNVIGTLGRLTLQSPTGSNSASAAVLTLIDDGGISGNSQVFIPNSQLSVGGSVIATADGQLLASKMFNVSGRDTGGSGFTNTGYFNGFSGLSINVYCPRSGNLQIAFSCDMGPRNSDFTSTGFMSVNVFNATGSFNVYAPSDNDAARMSMNTFSVNNARNTVSRTINVTGAGNGGDILTITPQFRTDNAGGQGFNWNRAWIAVVPSL